MSLLQKSKTRRYSVELPVELVLVLNNHLKEIFANKTRWFVEAIEKKMEEDRNELLKKLKPNE
ncbi:hypothetical protein EDM53_05800 [Rickettsiales endosymbiont of Peranema trichophorum]|uniref:hypothetical protein n=1 Tax=Rickettsiales endosymbiont of Peranema trichophorum TaxID=2486577 RepID=UPI001022A7D6|nr:hypothetical protein [Rickettsiales endosymbiont of Peranema trichophorum]RZI45146.1 hypothetical protein EDM53_05800 [Rickettsiales endosymbiont of Peranema trichophorum]